MSSLDPAELRRLAQEIQSDIDSGPEVNPYEITWGAASAIASALTDAAELAELAERQRAESKAFVTSVLQHDKAREAFEEELSKAWSERDAARAEVEHWRKARQTALDRGEILKAEIERLQAGIRAALDDESAEDPMTAYDNLVGALIKLIDVQ